MTSLTDYQAARAEVERLLSWPGADEEPDDNIRIVRVGHLRALLAGPPEPSVCPACYRGEVFGLSTDDGFWVEMGSSAGGANPHGMNGWIELIEHHPDGRNVRREYIATDSPLASRPDGWRGIESAPTHRPFWARKSNGEIALCWRHNPSSRTDEVVTWRGNQGFKAVEWRYPDPLPPAPQPDE